MATVVYTLGHSNVSADRIVELLNGHGVEILVDVRHTPYSRYNPQFNRESLAARAQEAGVDYRYAGDALGGLRANPTYRSGDETSYADIRRRGDYQAGLTQLLREATSHRTAILCSEEDPARCHRHHLIAQDLLRRGVEVRHIRGDASLEVAAKESEQLRLL